MKRSLTKFLALLGVFLFLGAGNAWADYYLVGTFTNRDWEAVDEYKFEKNNFGYFLHIPGKLTQGTYFKFATEKVFDGDYYGPNGWDGNCTTNEEADLHKGKNGAFIIPYDMEDVYVYFDPDRLKYQILQAPTIFGNYQGGNWGNDFYRLKPISVKENIWEGYVNVTVDNGYFRFKILDVEYGASSNDLPVKIADGKATNENANYTENNNYKSFKIQRGEYIVRVERQNNIYVFRFYNLPKKLYILGDLQGRDWGEEDFYEAECKNGKYYFQGVSIYNGDEKENYFAFFNDMDTDWDDKLPRFGCVVEEINSGSTNVRFNASNLPQTKSLALLSVNRDANVEYNFQINRGYYNIELDLKNWTITITEADPIQLDWHLGGANGSKLQDQDSHSVELPKDGNGYTIQVGVNGNAKHDAANNAVYTVWHKAKIDEIAQIDIKSGAIKPDGTTEVTGNSEYYYTSNKAELTLLKSGTYYIEANVKDELSDVYPGALGNSLVVTLAKANLDANITISNMEEAFSNNTDGFTFGSIDLGVSGLEYGKDFTFTLTPDETDGEWQKIENYDSESTDVSAAYKSLLTDGSLFTQYEQIASLGVVDGLYTQTSKYDAKTSSTSETTYDLYASFPCSGVYTLNLLPVSGSDYTFRAQSVKVTITPNLYLVYGDDTPNFNINGFGFTKESTNTIEYAAEYAVANLLKNSVAYKPGTYFDSNFALSIDNNESYNYAGDRVNNNSSWINFDFTSLATTQPTVYVTITKNGATGTFSYLFNKNTTIIPTAVEAIGAEEGEAVYYNLQGVRVDNPEHGIYVKVVNGKASKVVL